MGVGVAVGGRGPPSPPTGLESGGTLGRRGWLGWEVGGQGPCSGVLLPWTPFLAWLEPAGNHLPSLPHSKLLGSGAALGAEGLGGQDTCGNARTLALQSGSRHALQPMTRTSETVWRDGLPEEIPPAQLALPSSPEQCLISLGCD